MATLDRRTEATYDNRDPVEVGREAAARGDALLSALRETQRQMDEAVKELRRIADDLKGRTHTHPTFPIPPLADDYLREPMHDDEIRRRLGI